jgi:branched-chain amino acid transport system ATP-binding protein
MMTSLLELREVSVSYGAIMAVRDISLEAATGSIVALVGSNGAGKTTTLRAVVGLTPLCSGEIRIRGERIDTLDTAEVVRRGVAMSPEGRRLFLQMTVKENLLVGAHAARDRGAVGKTLNWVLARFSRVRELLHKNAASLSGGEQQMVAIGRALMAQPKLLLLDEPSLGLAPLMVREVARIIRDVNHEFGLSVVLVEQNARMALGLCHVGYVMERGQIVLAGSGRELLASSFVRKAYLGID